MVPNLSCFFFYDLAVGINSRMGLIMMVKLELLILFLKSMRCVHTLTECTFSDQLFVLPEAQPYHSIGFHILLLKRPV